MSWDLGVIGMLHRPLEGLSWPPMMIFPFFTISMARKKVDGRGLKAHPWRKAAGLIFVFACLMDTLVR